MTPRTDAATHHRSEAPHGNWVYAVVAQMLERELAEAQARIAELEGQLQIAEAEKIDLKERVDDLLFQLTTSD